jgi:murein L,D-transpeptidase YafK
MPRLRERAFWFLLVAIGAACLAAPSESPAANEATGCETVSHGALVFVDTARHSLSLCEGGRSTASYRVRLGRNGVGKSHEGDGKTPLGRYPLGEGRISAKYGLFLPLGYPTSEQRHRGFTGGSVGVHGPDRLVRWLGPLVNTFDTTDGCVGLASDSEMREITEWVRAHGARTIVLR